MLFFELWAQSGFGDRILDLWAVIAVTRLLEQKCMCKWLSGSQYPGFHSEYSTSLFSLPDVVWAPIEQEPPVQKERIFGQDSQIWGNHMTLILPHGIINSQIFPMNTFWGTTSLERVFEQLSFYGLKDIDPNKLVDAYYHVTRNTIPCEKIKDRINTDGAIGIHIRLSDKCVDNPSEFTMSKEDYQNIKHKCEEFIKQQDANASFLVCSEDTVACKAFKEFIRESGRRVLEPDYSNLKHDECALLDFFSMSRCIAIAQCTKYSTFSIAASLINLIPLINFHGFENNALGIWRQTANIYLA